MLEDLKSGSGDLEPARFRLVALDGVEEGVFIKESGVRLCKIKIMNLYVSFINPLK